ncbi:hypothetical protein BC937DRAFT_92614, partial [Endogone sp. FLAS-F59071]
GTRRQGSQHHHHHYHHTHAPAPVSHHQHDPDATTIRTVNTAATNFTPAQGTMHTGQDGPRRRTSLSHASANSRRGRRFFRAFLTMAAGLWPVVSWVVNGDATGREGRVRGMAGYPVNNTAWAMYRSWNLCQLFYTLPLIAVSMVALINPGNPICDIRVYAWLAIQVCIFYFQLACCLYILIRYAAFWSNSGPTQVDGSSIWSGRRRWWGRSRDAAGVAGGGSARRSNLSGRSAVGEAESMAEGDGQYWRRHVAARRRAVARGPWWVRYLLSPFFYSRVIMALFIIWSIVGVALVGWNNRANECVTNYDLVYSTSFYIIIFHISVIGLYCILWCCIPCVAVLWLHILPRQSSVPSRAATKEMIERLQCQRGSDMAWIDRAATSESGILDVEAEVDESPLCKHDIDQPWSPIRATTPSTHLTIMTTDTRISRSNSSASYFYRASGNATSTAALTAMTGTSLEMTTMVASSQPMPAQQATQQQQEARVVVGSSGAEDVIERDPIGEETTGEEMELAEGREKKVEVVVVEVEVEVK